MRASPGGTEGLVGEISVFFLHLPELLLHKITETAQSAKYVPNLKWPSQISDESVNKSSITIF